MRAVTLISVFLALVPPAAAAPSRTMGADEVAAEILHRIAARQTSGEARLDLDNPAIRLELPEGAATVTVEGLTYDPRTGRVAAYVAPDAAGAEGVRVTGRVRHMVDVPVLIRAVAPGETVTAQDVGRALLASDRLTQSFVTDPAELVGKTPRRTIRPSEPIRPVDVQTPVLVRRNELVTIVLQTPGVMLTAQGKAAEEGGKGATIRVANTKSGRVLDAVVTGPATVAVLTRPGVN